MKKLLLAIHVVLLFMAIVYANEMRIFFQHITEHKVGEVVAMLLFQFACVFVVIALLLESVRTYPPITKKDSK